jgi:lipopolysaccharide export system protein LptC
MACRAAMGTTSLTAAAHTAGAATHAWSASGPRDLARLIRVARRHSARVRLMRIGVPAGAAATAVLLALLTWLNPLRGLPELPAVSTGRLVVSGTKITMEAPKITGYTQDNRAYNLTAEAAAQDITNPTVLELSGIRARIELQGKGTVEVTAVAGLYNTKSELLTLTQYVHLMTSDGYEGHLTEASIDVRKGLIVSEKPVEVSMPNGKLDAKRMEIVDNGTLMRFDGGITLVLTGESGPRQKGARR